MQPVRFVEEFRLLHGNARGMEFLECLLPSDLVRPYRVPSRAVKELQVLIIFPAAILVNDLYVIPLLTCCCRKRSPEGIARARRCQGKAVRGSFF